MLRFSGYSCSRCRPEIGSDRLPGRVRWLTQASTPRSSGHCREARRCPEDAPRAFAAHSFGPRGGSRACGRFVMNDPGDAGGPGSPVRDRLDKRAVSRDRSSDLLGGEPGSATLRLTAA